MPVFRFVQKEITTHEIVVRADSEEEAVEWVGGLCDDEFPHSETDWEDTDVEPIAKKDEKNVHVDEDLNDYA